MTVNSGRSQLLIHLLFSRLSWWWNMMTLMVKMMLVWWNKYVGHDGNPVLMVIPMMISMTIIAISYQWSFQWFPTSKSQWTEVPPLWSPRNCDYQNNCDNWDDADCYYLNDNCDDGDYCGDDDNYNDDDNFQNVRNGENCDDSDVCNKCDISSTAARMIIGLINQSPIFIIYVPVFFWTKKMLL